MCLYSLVFLRIVTWLTRTGLIIFTAPVTLWPGPLATGSGSTKGSVNRKFIQPIPSLRLDSLMPRTQIKHPISIFLIIEKVTQHVFRAFIETLFKVIIKLFVAYSLFCIFIVFFFFCSSSSFVSRCLSFRLQLLECVVLCIIIERFYSVHAMHMVLSLCMVQSQLFTLYIINRLFTWCYRETQYYSFCMCYTAMTRWTCPLTDMCMCSHNYLQIITFCHWIVLCKPTFGKKMTGQRVEQP